MAKYREKLRSSSESAGKCHIFPLIYYIVIKKILRKCRVCTIIGHRFIKNVHTLVEVQDMRVRKRLLSLVLALLMVCGIAVPQTAAPVEAGVIASVTRNSNEQKIYSFLTEKMGLNSAAACGILANMYRECRFVETATNPAGPSYGICQWYSSNYYRLTSWCEANGMDYRTLAAQLYFLKYDLESRFRGTVLATLKSVPDTVDGAYLAGYTFCYNYERPKNYKTTASPSRGDLARTSFWPVYGGQRLIVELEASSHTHEYTQSVTPSTMMAAGSVVESCTVCGDIKSSTPIAQIAAVKLSKTSFVYNGKVNYPKVSVTDTNGNVISPSYYTVTYANKKSKTVGVYKVNVTFKGKYDGNVTQTYTITPKGTTINRRTAKSKGMQLRWKKITQQTSGYELQYAVTKNFTGDTAKTVTVSGVKTTSKTISKLAAKQKYYVRIRTFKTVKVDGKSQKVYSAWSKASCVTTKK